MRKKKSRLNPVDRSPKLQQPGRRRRRSPRNRPVYQAMEIISVMTSPATLGSFQWKPTFPTPELLPSLITLQELPPKRHLGVGWTQRSLPWVSRRATEAHPRDIPASDFREIPGQSPPLWKKSEAHPSRARLPTPPSRRPGGEGNLRSGGKPGAGRRRLGGRRSLRVTAAERDGTQPAAPPIGREVS